jgi:hypothetical protein
MKRIVMIAALGIGIFIAAPNGSVAVQKTAAGFIDGNTLFERCNAMGSFTGAGPGDVVIGSCMGYILGIADVMNTGAAVGRYKACFPPKVQFFQIRATVMADLKKFPQFRKLPAAQLVAAALAFAYPCREQTAVERRRGAVGKVPKK